MSLEQAQSILEGKKLKGINRDDERELLNYKKAMDFISKYLVKNGTISVNGYQSVASCIRRTAQRDLGNLIEKGVIKIVAKSPTDPTKHYILL